MPDTSKITLFEFEHIVETLRSDETLELTKTQALSLLSDIDRIMREP